MLGYVKKKLQEYDHIMSRKGQTCPYSPAPKQYGSEAQAPLPPNTLTLHNKAGIKQVQKIVGSILCYARAIDMTVLMALSTIQWSKQRLQRKQCIDACNY
jgi:hypothetical protein